MAFARSAPLVIAMGIVALFAISHGHAHGSEMWFDAAGGTFAAGFMLATALLHVAGIALGYAIGRLADGPAPARRRARGLGDTGKYHLTLTALREVTRARMPQGPPPARVRHGAPRARCHP